VYISPPARKDSDGVLFFYISCIYLGTSNFLRQLIINAGIIPWYYIFNVSLQEDWTFFFFLFFFASFANCQVFTSQTGCFKSETRWNPDKQSLESWHSIWHDIL